MPVIVGQRDTGVGTSAGAIQRPQNGPKTWETKILKWDPRPLVFHISHCLFFRGDGGGVAGGIETDILNGNRFIFN